MIMVKSNLKLILVLMSVVVLALLSVDFVSAGCTWSCPFGSNYVISAAYLNSKCVDDCSDYLDSRSYRGEAHPDDGKWDTTVQESGCLGGLCLGNLGVANNAEGDGKIYDKCIGNIKDGKVEKYWLDGRGAFPCQ